MYIYIYIYIYIPSISYKHVLVGPIRGLRDEHTLQMGG